MECVLCRAEGETVLWSDERCRVLLADEPGYPGFCRVVWNGHVAEMTDLAPAEREHLMEVVFAVEEVLRRELRPLKVNLASLGNRVPHVHWHVIPRFGGDPTFPDAVWAGARRTVSRADGPEPAALSAALARALARAGP